MDDYRATRLDLSPGRALYASLSEFQFRRYTPLRVSPAGEVNMMSARDWARYPVVPPPSHRDCVEAIVCHVDRAYKNIHDWKHFVQLAFPCWSLFERYPRAAHYLDIHPTRFKRVAGSGGDMVSTWNPWIAALNAQYARAGVRFLGDPNQTHFDERSLPVSGRRCEWVANTTVTTDDFGWAEPSGDGPLHNFRYFMRRADIAAFQRSVLGREFERGPPGDGQRVRGLTTTTTFRHSTSKH